MSRGLRNKTWLSCLLALILALSPLHLGKNGVAEAADNENLAPGIASTTKEAEAVDNLAKTPNGGGSMDILQQDEAELGINLAEGKQTMTSSLVSGPAAVDGDLATGWVPLLIDR
jgi:hypothetical protein